MVFEEMRLHRIEALVQPDNLRSVNLLNALGFVPEGIRRENIRMHGAWRDHQVFSRLSTDQDYPSR